MPPPHVPRDSRLRWLAINFVRLLGIAGAVLGVALIAKAHILAPRLIGAALVLAAVYFAAVVPAALAHRWRSGA